MSAEGPARAELASAARELGLSLPSEQIDALLAYLALLQRWNATYNLTAVRDPVAMLRQHLLDCLAVVAPLQHHLPRLGAASRAQVLDVGSGGGLPGVVIAIVCPTLDVTCVDTVGKKAAFIRQCAAELRLPNLRAEHARVESLRPPANGFHVITSRAFASLSDFTRLTSALLAPQGAWMAMKGQVPQDEITALPPTIGVTGVEALRVPGLDASRCLVWMQHADTAP